MRTFRYALKEDPNAANSENGTSNKRSYDEAINGDIAEKARKNFRRDTETRLAEGSQMFLRAFGDVDKVSAWPTSSYLYVLTGTKKLNELEVHINDMRTRCDDTSAKLQATSETCQHLLERASGLRTQRCVGVLTRCEYADDQRLTSGIHQAEHRSATIDNRAVPVSVHAGGCGGGGDCFERRTSGEAIV